MDETAYASSVEELVARALFANPGADLEKILPLLRGAPPEVVWPLLESKRRRSGRPAPLNHNDSIAAEYEPHPLDYDWTFTPKTSDWLAHCAVSAGRRIALMGIPSVFDILFQRRRDCVLIDRNPTKGSGPTFIVADLCHDKLPSMNLQFDVVVIDAPWYPEILVTWLNHALRLTTDCGVIFFSLWGELTRPSAAQERDNILRLLSLSGRVTAYFDVLEYESPLFEQQALKAANLPQPRRWRRGDLIRLDKRGAVPLPRPRIRRSSEWHRFSLGSRQIAIRAPGSSSGFLKHFELEWRTLPSVSRRFPTRETIGIWLSNNAVSSTGNFSALRRYLRDGVVTDSSEVASLLAVSEVRRNHWAVGRSWRQSEWTAPH